MKTKAELRSDLLKARANTLTANAHYKRTWRAHPTAKGFGRVDIALDALHQAEANERALERELAQ